MHQKLVVVTGSSGVGKSTLAKVLQEELLPEHWLHFSADTLFYCLPQSVTLKIDQENAWHLADWKKLSGSAHACVSTLLERGYKVIFDTVIMSDSGAQALLAAFSEMSPLLVELTCSWDEIKKRTLTRGDRTLEEAERGYKNAGGHLSAHHKFDTTGASMQEIARQLSAHVRGSPSAA